MAAPKLNFPSISQKSLEIALEEFQQIFDILPLHIICKDDRSNIVKVNRYAAQAMGVTPEEMENQPTEKFFGKQLSEKYFRDDLEVIRSGKPKLGIVEQIDDGETLGWVKTDKFPRYNDAGEIIGVMLVAEDITELKRTSEELAEVRRTAAIGLRTAEIVHNIKNPLSVALGFVHRFTKQGVFSAEAASKIEKPLNRIVDIISNVLTSSRHDALSAKTQVCLASVLRDELQIVGVGQQVDTAIETELDCSEDLVIEAKKSHIEQVFGNLIKNAVEAMEASAVRKLSIRAHDEGGYVKVTFADSGEGIHAKNYDRVFEPRFTTKTHGDSVQAGTGLGLAFCNRVVRSYGGSLTFTSEVGKGSTFTVILPKQPAVL